MTLEPTLTIERTSPEPTPAITPPSDATRAQFVVSQIASNQAQPLNMGAARKGSTNRRIMPAATPFAMPSVIRPVVPEKYPPRAMASAGIRLLWSKAKIEAGLVFEDIGEAFVLKSIVTTSMERITLWSGMEISKTVFADLLGRLQKFGFAEFSTLGTAGSGNFDRATFRAAFQVKNNEWLTLVRVKAATGNDAIVGFVSGASIQMHLPAFHGADMPTAKAA